MFQNHFLKTKAHNKNKFRLMEFTDRFLLINNQVPIEQVGSGCKALVTLADQGVQGVQRVHRYLGLHLFRGVLVVPGFLGSSFRFLHCLLGVLEGRVVQALPEVPGVLGLGFGQVVHYLQEVQHCQGFQEVQRVQQVQVDLVDWAEPGLHHLHHLQEVPWDPVRLRVRVVPLGKAVDKVAA